MMGWQTLYDRVVSGASRCLIIFACTSGAVKIEGRTLCLWLQVRKAAWQEKLLPAVEDGCAALIVQLQVGWDSFSGQGLKDYCGADSYFSLINKHCRARMIYTSKQHRSQDSAANTVTYHPATCLEMCVQYVCSKIQTDISHRLFVCNLRCIMSTQHK